MAWMEANYQPIWSWLKQQNQVNKQKRKKRKKPHKTQTGKYMMVAKETRWEPDVRDLTTKQTNEETTKQTNEEKTKQTNAMIAAGILS